MKAILAEDENAKLSERIKLGAGCTSNPIGVMRRIFAAVTLSIRPLSVRPTLSNSRSLVKGLRFTITFPILTLPTKVQSIRLLSFVLSLTVTSTWDEC